MEPVADDIVTRERVETIARHVAEAHAAVARSDAAGAGWRARLAAESMLQVLCEVHGVPLPGAVPGETTLATLRKALRHAKVLDRSLEDHFAHVQNVGNRAAHAQAVADLAVDLDEARALLPILDHVWARFLERIPAHLRPADAPVPGPTRWLRTLLITGALLATPVVTFLGVVAILGRAAAPEPPHAAAAEPPHAAAPVPGEPVVHADAAPPPAPTPPPAPPTPPPDAAALVRADRPVGPPDLAGLGCEELAVARNWLWARHGLRLRDESAFVGAPGYHPFTDDVAAVRRRFTDTDERNLRRLDEALRAKSCPCPKRPGQPCPR